MVEIRIYGKLRQYLKEPEISDDGILGRDMAALVV